MITVSNQQTLKAHDTNGSRKNHFFFLDQTSLPLPQPYAVEKQTLPSNQCLLDPEKSSMAQSSIFNIWKKLSPSSPHPSHLGRQARGKESEKTMRVSACCSTQNQRLHPKSFHTSAFQVRRPGWVFYRHCIKVLTYNYKWGAEDEVILGWICWLLKIRIHANLWLGLAGSFLVSFTARGKDEVGYINNSNI